MHVRQLQQELQELLVAHGVSRLAGRLDIARNFVAEGAVLARAVAAQDVAVRLLSEAFGVIEIVLGVAWVRHSTHTFWKFNSNGIKSRIDTFVNSSHSHCKSKTFRTGHL